MTCQGVSVWSVYIGESESATVLEDEGTELKKRKKKEKKKKKGGTRDSTRWESMYVYVLSMHYMYVEKTRYKTGSGVVGSATGLARYMICYCAMPSLVPVV